MSAIADRIIELICFPIELVARFFFSVSSRRLRRRMKRLGRLTDLGTVADHLRNGTGTLVVEATTPGWPTYRVWLTDDAAGYQARPENWSEDRLYPEEDDINFDRFLSEAAGRALLVPSWYYGQHIDRFLHQYFGAAKLSDCLFIWSGWIKPR